MNTSTPARPELDLPELLRRVARARHDLNNPLTSALAETQLLLLDVSDPEVREGLLAIKGQLHRIRDLVAALSFAGAAGRDADPEARPAAGAERP